MFCCVPSRQRVSEPVAFEDDLDYHDPNSPPVMPSGQPTPRVDESRLALSKSLSELAIFNQQSPDDLSRNQSSLSLNEWDQPHQTEIIFDWDDTLFPTTWLRSQSDKIRWQDPIPSSSPFIPIFHDCSTRVVKLLTAAAELANVSIVTLGAPSWLRHSLRNFMPEVLQAMSILQVKVAFAREELQPLESVQDSIELKRRAMNRLITKFYSHYPEQSWKNVISIGDSPFERQALLDVVEAHQQPEGKRCRTKTIKLADAPDLQQFNSQLDLLTTWLRLVIRYDDDCDIDLNGSIEDVLKWKKVLTN